ncbi:TetR family transcriptional regulator [Demetria terragena]|uniref:TetR family transcriptional regulator n=1 Tax=Demetria terragena TaxID=63959 RepID=UPI0003A47489|nr:TetR family transcriptional regulator [Demetria terragena]
MSRWQPNSRERLEQAALELFGEQGFDDTTVPQITERAGLTTRTFFRYFADKREALFGGEEHIPEQVAAFMADVPPSVGPMELIERGLAPAAAVAFEGRNLDYLQRRRAVIAAEPALRERELRKFALMSDAMTQGFLDRGLSALDARLAAEVAVTAFRIGATQWIDQGCTSDLTTTIRKTLRALQTLATPSSR